MRVRIVLAVTAAAFALTTGSASAADGEFLYQYQHDGGIDSGALVDPPSRECVNLPEVEETPYYASRVQNSTYSTVTVFKDQDCEGDYYSLRPRGKVTSDRLLVKSVIFS